MMIMCNGKAVASVVADITESNVNKTGFYNPVIWADYPDPDIIRVGDDFYMVSTTMHIMPGCPVMHSKDLVNWETIGYVYDTLNDHSRYDLQDGTVYGKGQWATSIRYRDGKYYVLFSPNDQPYKSYIYTAENPAGPWSLLTRTDHFHDASLLLDDDGKAYVFYNGGEIRLRQLKDDLTGVLDGGIDKVVIFPDESETGLHEGSRVIKHNGKYYAFVISWPAGKPRRQLCYRADNIEGPYEKCVVLQSEFGGFPYVGQGCLVDDTEGNWWGMIFQDRGGIGRVLTLNPATWKDGWPMLGDKDGNVPAFVEKKLVRGNAPLAMQSDEFDNGNMSVLWGWNHNPVNDAWSLMENPGNLRLTTVGVVPNLFLARNTLTQRMEGPMCEGAVKMNVSSMKPGDIAGLAAFNGDTGYVGIECDDNGKWIVARKTFMKMQRENHGVAGTDDSELLRIPFDGENIWLKVYGDFNPGEDWATLSYSSDGENWNEVPEKVKMIFDYRRFFMGTRFAIFNYATREAGGHIDVDWFRCRHGSQI